MSLQGNQETNDMSKNKNGMGHIRQHNGDGLNRWSTARLDR